jgi:hypothetical protein
MRLPDEVFEEICMNLGVGPPETDELYRRRCHRFPAEAEVTVYPAGIVQMRPRQVTLVNISASGVCLVDDVTSHNGQQLVIELPRIGGNTLTVLCTVRQSRLTAHGQYRVGAEFTNEYKVSTRVPLASGASGMMTTAGQVRPAPGTDNGGWEAEVAMLGAGPGVAVAATVCERSRTALGLIVYKSIAVGDRFVVRFVPPGGQPIKCMCTATHVRMLDHGKFRVGARVEGIAVQPQRTGLIGWVLKTFCCVLLWLGMPLADATSPEALGQLSQASDLLPLGRHWLPAGMESRPAVSLVATAWQQAPPGSLSGGGAGWT